MKAKLEAKVEMEKRDKRSKAKKWVYSFFSLPLVASRSFYMSYTSDHEGKGGSEEIVENTREWY